MAKGMDLIVSLLGVLLHLTGVLAYHSTYNVHIMGLPLYSFVSYFFLLIVQGIDLW